MVVRGIPPVEVDTSLAFALEKSRIVIERLHLTTRDSRVDVSGVLTNPRVPRGKVSVKASMPMKDAVQMFGATLAPVGSGTFDGQIEIAFMRPMEFAMTGRMNARGVGYADHGLNITGADVRADVRVGLQDLAFNNVSANAGGVNVTGSGKWRAWKQFHFDGDVGGVDLREAARITTGNSSPGMASSRVVSQWMQWRANGRPLCRLRSRSRRPRRANESKARSTGATTRLPARSS